MKKGSPRTHGVASEFVGSTIAYFDCFSGISGDMTLGALIDAGADRSLVDAAVEALRLGDEVTVAIRRETRGHAGGTRVVVRTEDRIERTVPALRRVVEATGAPARVKRPALDAIGRLAQAEARIHDVPEDMVHLHELGGADTLVDLVCAFWMLHSGGFELRARARGRVGYAIGGRDEPGNALAVWIGDEVRSESGVTLVETNLDDMAPNLIAALCEDLMAAGALDVTVTPALMKKGRSGHVLAVMSPPELVASLSEHLFRHSTT